MTNRSLVILSRRQALTVTVAAVASVTTIPNAKAAPGVSPHLLELRSALQLASEESAYWGDIHPGDSRWDDDGADRSAHCHWSAREAFAQAKCQTLNDLKFQD